MPKTVAKLEDFEVLLTIGTGSFGTCRKVRRRADGKVCSCIRDGLARQTGRGLGGGSRKDAHGRVYEQLSSI